MSVTEIASPAVIAVADSGDEVKILLGERNSEITSLLVAKIAELFVQPRVVVMLGFTGELTLEDVRRIVAELRGKLEASQ